MQWKQTAEVLFHVLVTSVNRTYLTVQNSSTISPQQQEMQLRLEQIGRSTELQINLKYLKNEIHSFNQTIYRIRLKISYMQNNHAVIQTECISSQMQPFCYFTEKII